MDYYLIKGYFHVVGYAPDGDSLVFEANNPKHWNKIHSDFRDIFQEKFEANEGNMQLRLQGIDALETHYTPSPHPTPPDMRGKSYAKAERPKARNIKQPATFGDEATRQMLEYLGVEEIGWGSSFGNKYIKNIVYNSGKRRTTYKRKNKDKIPGYIIINDFDRKGRPIAWIYPGKTRTRDGSRLTSSKMKERVKPSLNYKLVARGLVYPYFFMTLAAALRDQIIHGVLNAQRQKMGLWAEDRSLKGITLRKFSTVEEKYLIFPYLFRRMAKHQYRRQLEEYWEAVENKKEYKQNDDKLYLDSFFVDSNPYVFLVDERDFVRLDSIVYLTKTKMKLRTHPGNIIFLS